MREEDRNGQNRANAEQTQMLGGRAGGTKEKRAWEESESLTLLGSRPILTLMAWGAHGGSRAIYQTRSMGC